MLGADITAVLQGRLDGELKHEIEQWKKENFHKSMMNYKKHKRAAAVGVFGVP